ncbi:MAG TPA: hypothetical protein VGF48_15790 [Thermoanaerobaculia bacterium]
MKPNATLILPLLLLFALPAFAQESDDDVDYSRDTLMRIFVAEAPREERPPITFHVGTVQFNALGTRWNFAYLPFLAPLHGTTPRTSQEMPDPFLITRTVMATPPRVARQQRRAINAEIRRIERTERERAKLSVTTSGDK